MSYTWDAGGRLTDLDDTKGGAQDSTTQVFKTVGQNTSRSAPPQPMDMVLEKEFAAVGHPRYVLRLLQATKTAR